MGVVRGAASNHGALDEWSQAKTTKVILLGCVHMQKKEFYVFLFQIYCLVADMNNNIIGFKIH
jgi:hypothetical protein